MIVKKTKDYTLNLLTKSEFEENPLKYQEGFDRISISQMVSSGLFFGFLNWSVFFKNHDVNRVFYIINKDNTIVSFACATPLLNICDLKSKSSDYWYLNYVQTLKDEEHAGLATILLNEMAFNLKQNGVKELEFLANDDSFDLIMSAFYGSKYGKIRNTFNDPYTKVLVFT